MSSLRMDPSDCAHLDVQINLLGADDAEDDLTKPADPGALLDAI